MVYLINILIMLLLSLLTVSFLPNFTVFGVVPLLPLFFVIGLTYFRKGFEPVLIAALAGVLLDFYSSYGFGLYLTIFLGIAIAVRVFYQEGMKEMSFWSFVIISTASLTLYYLAQVLLLINSEVGIGFVSILKPYALFMLINAVYLLLAYPFNIWYFEKMKVLEDYQKRR